MGGTTGAVAASREANMSTDTLQSLFFEEIRDVRSVKRQILEVLSRIAKGVSAEAMGQALMKLLETTEHHVERLDRIFDKLRPQLGDAADRFPSIAQGVRPELERRSSSALETHAAGYSRLTSREAEVLQLIAEGYANKQIAAELAISIKTVEKHRQRMMAKLDLHDTAGVTRFAVSMGVVEASA
jgi:DNA-binding CsgD family transcriptional regulator